MLPKARQRPRIDLDHEHAKFTKKRRQGKNAPKEFLLCEAGVRLSHYPNVLVVKDRTQLTSDRDTYGCLMKGLQQGLSTQFLLEAYHNKVTGEHAEIMLQSTLDMAAHRLFATGDRPPWFEPSEGLAWQLLATETKGVRCDDIAFPFDAFVLDVPRDWMFLTSNTGMHEVMFAVVIHEAYTKMDRPECTGQLLVILYGGRGTEGVLADNQTLYFSNPLIPGMDFDAAAAQDAQHDVVTQDVWASDQIVGRIGADAVSIREIRESILRYVTNFLLYVASPSADVTAVNADAIAKLKSKGKNLRKIEVERLQELEIDRTFTVGTNVPVNAEVRDLVYAGKSERSLTYRTLVRGHWRNQPYGPERSLRKLLWIQPHIRGKDIADTVTAGHTYRVT